MVSEQAALERYLRPMRGLLSFGRRGPVTQASLRGDVEHWQRGLQTEQVLRPPGASSARLGTQVTSAGPPQILRCLVPQPWLCPCCHWACHLVRRISPPVRRAAACAAGAGVLCKPGLGRCKQILSETSGQCVHVRRLEQRRVRAGRGAHAGAAVGAGSVQGRPGLENSETNLMI